MSAGSTLRPAPSLRYVLGGLSIASELHFPSLPATSTSTGTEDLTLVVDLVGPSPEPSTWLVERSEPGFGPYLRVSGNVDRYLLVHVDGVELEVARGTALTVRHLDPRLDPRDLEHLLVDQLLPLVIGRLGRLSLHGGAVAWGESVVALLAPSGTGKSTFVAAATEAGATFLADDQVVLEPVERGFLAHPSYPFARLWGDSVDHVFSARSPAARGPRKHHVPLRISPRPLPLRAIVLLERGPSLEIERLGRRDAVPAVAEHIDRLDPTDRALLRRELELLATLAETTEVVRLRRVDDLSRLDEAVAMVRRHVAAG